MRPLQVLPFLIFTASLNKLTANELKTPKLTPALTQSGADQLPREHLSHCAKTTSNSTIQMSPPS